MGTVAELHASPDHPNKDIFLLWLTGVVFTIFGIIIVFVKRALKAERQGCMHIISKTVSLTLLLTGSWCFLFALDWHFLALYPVHVVMARLMVALFGGIFFVFWLLVLSYIEYLLDDPEVRVTFKSVYTMLALLVGLSWEKTFHVALESYVAQESSGNATEEKLCSMVTNFFLVLIFLPGFGVVMMPHHHPELSKTMKGKHFFFWQTCCDLPCQDESTEDDEEEDYGEIEGFE